MTQNIENYHKQNALCEEKFKNIDKTLDKISSDLARIDKVQTEIEIGGSDPLKKHLEEESETHSDLDREILNINNTLNNHDRDIKHIDDKSAKTLDKLQTISENLQSTTGIINNISEQMTNITKEVQKKAETKNAIYIAILSTIGAAILLFCINTILNRIANKNIDINASELKIHDK